jgi:hypothetical protein
MTRPCHTGACANVHPCHVPYTVCTIVGFSGDSTRTWPHHLSKSLATTLVVITTTRQRIVELFSFVVMVLYDVVTIHCVHIRVPVAKLQMCQYFCNYSCNDNLFSVALIRQNLQLIPLKIEGYQTQYMAICTRAYEDLQLQLQNRNNVKVHRYSATICATVGIVLRPTRRLSIPYNHKSCTVHTVSSVISKNYKLHYPFQLSCLILLVMPDTDTRP